MTKKGNCENQHIKIKQHATVTFALFVLFTFLAFNNNLVAQKNFSELIKYAKEKKISAKEMLPMTDKLATDLIYDAQHPSRLEFSERKNTFVAGFDTLLIIKDEIKLLDPKCKTKTIDESLTICKPTYDKLNGDRVKFDENQKIFDRYAITFKELKEKFVLAEENGELLEFVNGKGKFNYSWSQILMIADSALVVQDYISKYNKFKEKRYITGLDFFKDGDNPGYKTLYINLLSVINNQSIYKDLPANSNGEARVNQYATLSKTLNKLEAYLILSPENAELKAAQAKVKAIHNNAGKAFDKIVTGPFHKANLNKVFLSDHKITLGTESEKDFKTTFKGGETVYVIHYLGEKIAVQKASDQYLNLIDGIMSAATFVPMLEKYGSDSISVIQYALAPDLGTATSKELMRIVEPLRRLDSQKVGKSKYELRVSDKIDLNFYIETSANENYSKHLQAARVAKMSTINLPKTGMSDASVEAKVKSQLEEMTEEHYKNITVVSVVILSKDWDVFLIKNTKEIKNRSLNNVVAICKDNNGNCFLIPGNFSQDRLDGNYSKGAFNTTGYYYETTEDYILTDEHDRLYFNCSKL